MIPEYEYMSQNRYAATELQSSHVTGYFALSWSSVVQGPRSVITHIITISGI